MALRAKLVVFLLAATPPAAVAEQACAAGAECASSSSRALLQHQVEHKRSKLAIADLQLAASAEGCKELPGQGWEAAVAGGESDGKDAPWFLCMQRDPLAASGITRMEVLPRVDATANQSAGLDADCASLGKQFRQVRGLDDSSKSAELNLCMESMPLDDAKGSYITSVELVRPSAIRRSACGGFSEAARVLQAPGLAGADLLDDSPLLCIGSVKTTTSAALAQYTPVPLTFAPQDMSIPSDPIAERDHVFVVGSESSGTRLWTHIVASAQGLTEEDFEGFQLNSKTAIFHFSLPWGSMCTRVDAVPTLLDLGATEADYELATGLSPRKIYLRERLGARRVNLDLKSVVEKYKGRGEKVKVLMLVRDPAASMASKIANHCSDTGRAAAEQRKAFELMLEASSLEEVTTICYEEMLEGGASFVNDVLHKLKLTPRSVPYIHNENTKYVTMETVGGCTEDMKSYLTLCPKSPLASSFRAACNGDN